ncbi:hypothetical protein GHO26_12225 [Pseudomonas helleri]|uniref:hypothetical protein n=1 Tax=Pseudomonas helleri TaxID=1608996 RepID=UPI0012952686|nr:hypothetical protein [Pseudomonas helleri]MQU58546.1 hypothetical protein [Pseudomonas helleri]
MKKPLRRGPTAASRGVKRQVTKALPAVFHPENNVYLFGKQVREQLIDHGFQSIKREVNVTDVVAHGRPVNSPM